MRPKGYSYCQYEHDQGEPSVSPSQSRPKDSDLIEREQHMAAPSARPHPQTFIINVLIMSLMILAVAAPARAILANNYDSGMATNNGGFSPTTGVQGFYRADEKPPLAYANYEDPRGVVGEQARQQTGFVPSTMSAAGQHYAAANNMPPPTATIDEEQMIHGDGMGGEVSARPKIKFDYETKANNYDASAYGYQWKTQPAGNRLPLLYKQYSDYLHHQGDQRHQRPGDLRGIPEQEDTRGIHRAANKSPLRKRPLRRRQYLETTSSSDMNYQAADSNGQPIPLEQHYEEENSGAGYQNTPPAEYTDPLMQLHEMQQKMHEHLMRYDELQRQLLQQKHSMLQQQQQQQTQRQTPQYPQYEQQQYNVQSRDNYQALQHPRANDLSTDSPHPAAGPTSSITYSVDPSLPAITSTIHHTPASKAAAAGIPLSRHVQVTKHIPVAHYQQLHVPYNHTVPIRIPQPMITTVPRPYPIEVPVSKTIAVPKLQEITIPVEKVKPYAVERPTPYIVERRVPYRVEKHVPSPVYYPYPVTVPIVKTIVHKIGDSHTRLLRHSPNIRFVDHLMV